jgi:hypothetical protein
MGGVNLANAKLVCETLGHQWTRELMIKVSAAASGFLEGKREGAETGTFKG